MINYERIAAEAAEMARQFWQEIEDELVRQSCSLDTATPMTWLSGADAAVQNDTSMHGMNHQPSIG